MEEKPREKICVYFCSLKLLFGTQNAHRDTDIRNAEMHGRKNPMPYTVSASTKLVQATLNQHLFHFNMCAFVSCQFALVMNCVQTLVHTFFRTLSISFHRFYIYINITVARFSIRPVKESKAR